MSKTKKYSYSHNLESILILILRIKLNITLFWNIDKKRNLNTFLPNYKLNLSIASTTTIGNDNIKVIIV